MVANQSNDKRAPPALSPERDALFLDFDGTLVDFATEPDAILVPDFLTPLLTDLMEELGGALALVSGRRIDSLDHHLGSEFPAAGQHGHELRFPGKGVELKPVSPELDDARQRLAGLLNADDPLIVEDKGAALVLHYRSAPEQEDRAIQVADKAAEDLSDLKVVFGHSIAEIRPRDAGKAGAVSAFLDVSPFAGRRPIFVGDDTTDEDGFGAVQDIGGFGIKVGTGASVAEYRLSDIAGVYDWLKTTEPGNSRA